MSFPFHIKVTLPQDLQWRADHPNELAGYQVTDDQSFTIKRLIYHPTLSIGENLTFWLLRTGLIKEDHILDLQDDPVKENSSEDTGFWLRKFSVVDYEGNRVTTESAGSITKETHLKINYAPKEPESIKLEVDSQTAKQAAMQEKIEALKEKKRQIQVKLTPLKSQKPIKA